MLTYFTSFGAFNGPLDELVIDRMLNECSGTGTANLTLIEEDAVVCRFNGLFDVDIGQYDIGTFTTQF